MDKTACEVNSGCWLVGRTHPSQQFTQKTGPPSSVKGICATWKSGQTAHGAPSLRNRPIDREFLQLCMEGPRFFPVGKPRIFPQ